MEENFQDQKIEAVYTEKKVRKKRRNFKKMGIEIQGGVSERVIDNDRFVLMIKIWQAESCSINPKRESDDKDQPKPRRNRGARSGPQDLLTAFTMKRSANRLGTNRAI